MILHMMKTKIHRATVTQADLNYVGSLTLDTDLMEAAGLQPYERVWVLNINTGDRFDTYVIEGEAGSGVVCLNGAAARLGQKGDLVIIVAYCMMDAAEAEGWIGRAVMVDKHNRVTSIEAGEKAGPLPAELMTV
jgi:aspartate 1-decarboxylase